MTNRKCKLFLLSTVTYQREKNSSFSYVDALRVFAANYPDIKGFESIDALTDDTVYYEETPGEANLDEIDFKSSISMARALRMSLHETLTINHEKLGHHSSDFSLSDIKASIFFDAHAFIFIGYEITLEYAEAIDSRALLRALFDGRNIFENLGLADLHQEHKTYLENRLEGVFRLNGLKPVPGNIRLERDYTLPALFLPHCDADFIDLFKNEETREQIESHSTLEMRQHHPSFFHVGWNYTVAAGFSKEVFINLLHVITACQGYFFTLMGLKNYLRSELNSALDRNNLSSHFQVRKAEFVQSAFAHVLSAFHEYKSRLYPKYRIEVEQALRLWHCNEDVENIKEFLELDIKGKQKKQSDRVEKALFALALFQILTVISVFNDAATLFRDFAAWLWVALFLVFMFGAGLIAFLKIRHRKASRDDD